MKTHQAKENTQAAEKHNTLAKRINDQRTNLSTQLQRQQQSDDSQQIKQLKQRFSHQQSPENVAIQRVEDDEPLQKKADVMQRIEEEEPAQRAKADEEPLQAKFDIAQRVEEGEPAQRAKLDEVPIQGKFDTVQRIEEEEPAQKKSTAAVNNTGLPNQLKAGIESMSGMSMDHVKVHYNSDKPAQLNAHAYAQGSDIHVAPGQEQHVPHEAWHVVQQAQGRVKPTMQMKMGVPVNDDVGLETEADVMGVKALIVGSSSTTQAFGMDRYNTAFQSTGVMQQRTAVNYVGHFAARHILVGASDEQAIARAASRQDPAQHNHVLTDTNELRDTAFEDQLTLECADEARAANYEFVVTTPAKKASKVRNDPNPNGGSPRRHVGNYDLTATVDEVTAVLDSDIEQDADAATIKTVKD